MADQRLTHARSGIRQSLLGPCLAALSLVATVAGARQVSFPEDATYVALIEKVQELKPGVVSIQVETAAGKMQVIGSGFMVRIQDSSSILTCRHVVEYAQKLGRLVVGLNTPHGEVLVRTTSARLDKTLDLAQLQLANRIIAPPVNWDSSAMQLVVAHLGIGLSMFAADSEIVEGAGVLLIGFPLGLGVSKQADRPISRLGMVAQGVYELPVFLVDGTASKGNSGSPVFLSSTKKLVGMVYAQASDAISAYDEQGRVIASLPYNAGIATCIPASAIRAFLVGP